MSPRGLPALLVAGLLGVLAASLNSAASALPPDLRAAAPAPPTGPSSRPPAAVGMHRLVQACAAGERQPYSGQQVVTVNFASSSRSSRVDIVHVPGAGVRLRVTPAPNGSGVYTGPQRGLSLLRAVDDGTLATIASRYDVSAPVAAEPVAGRPTDLVELRRRTGNAAGSVAARFWLDRQTALPLRRQVLDGAGRIQTDSAFTRISFRPLPPAALRAATPSPAPSDSATPGPLIQPALGQPAALSQGVSPQQLDALRAGDWFVPATLPEGLDLVDARWEEAGGQTPADVLHLSYTDGVAVLSVFEQRGRLDSATLAGWQQQRRGKGTVWTDAGMPERVVWSSQGRASGASHAARASRVARVYTVVSDDPSGVDAALASMPAPTGAPGVLERLRRGVARLGSWINPFG